MFDKFNEKEYINILKHIKQRKEIDKVYDLSDKNFMYIHNLKSPWWKLKIDFKEECGTKFSFEFTRRDMLFYFETYAAFKVYFNQIMEMTPGFLTDFIK